MSLGLILVIILVIALLGGFSGRFGGYGYGYGHGGVGVLGVVLIVVVVLLLTGRDLIGRAGWLDEIASAACRGRARHPWAPSSGPASRAGRRGRPGKTRELT